MERNPASLLAIRYGNLSDSEPSHVSAEVDLLFHVFSNHYTFQLWMRRLALSVSQDHCLSSGKKPKLSWLWWTLYTLCDDPDTCEQDYLRA